MCIEGGGEGSCIFFRSHFVHRFHFPSFHNMSSLSSSPPAIIPQPSSPPALPSSAPEIHSSPPADLPLPLSSSPPALPPSSPSSSSSSPQMPSSRVPFRFVVLLVATACLSMMLANILTLNFTILCMTEERSRWAPLHADLGFEVFEAVNFEGNGSAVPVSAPAIPSLDSPSGNWHHFRLARYNPQLFVRLLKARAVEMAKSHGDNIDLEALRKGLNLTEMDADIMTKLGEFVVKTVTEGKKTILWSVANATEWSKIRLEHLELHNFSWNGFLEGRVNLVEREPDVQYSARQKGMLFGVIAIGALIAIPMVGVSIDRCGCRKTFALVCLISASATALCPVAVSLGFFPFLFVRLIQGVGFAACFPVIGAVTSAWARLSENGLFNGALTSFIQLAPVITMPLSGLLCASIGWRHSFHVHALLTFVLAALWWLIYRDSAGEHRRVPQAELRLIQEGKGDRNGAGRAATKRIKFPFKRICSDVSVWAIWVAALANMYAIQMMIMFAPTYIREILHYTIVNVGFASALPTLLQFVVKMVAGVSSDRLGWDETRKVRFFNSIAFCGMATFMLALAFTPARHFRLSLLFIVLSVTMLGFNTGGFFKSATLIGRQYAYFIGAKIQVIMCFAMLTVPMVVYSLTPTNSPSEWSLVFLLHALFLLVANVVFCFIGSGNAAPFTYIAASNGKMAEEVIKPLGPNGIQQTAEEPENGERA